ncbi:MAG: V-type ATP synthase subunit F [Nanoarchaeota archaeon]|nr:V-type ATP synthase subunit F [Nanoarchaeota archaeon]
MNLAVIGGSEFVLGFQLAGITKTFEIKEGPLNDINKCRQDPNIGVVVIEEDTLDKLDSHDRMLIEESVNPVFIHISKEATSEGLRKLIKKSIGVDLWKDDQG